MRYKILLSFVTVVFSYFVYGQKNVDGLVAAEKGFAAYSIANNTKDAFLKNIDSAAVYLNKNGDATNGIAYWSNAEKRSSKLNWMPEYAEISSSGDFGYTTGPWYLYQTSSSSAPAARGHFITIWHLDNNQTWKFLLDLGISYQSKMAPKTSLSVSKKVNKKTVDNTPVDIIAIDKNFIQLFAQDKANAYNTFLSKNCRLNKDGLQPFTYRNHERYVSSIPAKLTFSPVGSFTSTSNDLAVVYGNTIVEGKKENYLRIWRKEKQKWKIALEVLHY